MFECPEVQQMNIQAFEASASPIGSVKSVVCGIGAPAIVQESPTKHFGGAMIDVASLDTASPAEEKRFFTVFESVIARDDGEAAKEHLVAGRPIYVSDARFPGRAVRVHPDGRRELMRLDLEKGVLVVERAV
uniref:hypothetical protein n=1 Tax=Cupriavidus gilardii TaxID=82541 RepID=UPI00247AE145|nr:hypothetical protein [Cupriavidus gilardii]WDE72697.1 hypothetical protein [Cupriavidus gilardii]